MRKTSSGGLVDPAACARCGNQREGSLSFCRWCGEAFNDTAATVGPDDQADDASLSGPPTDRTDTVLRAAAITVLSGLMALALGSGDILLMTGLYLAFVTIGFLIDRELFGEDTEPSARRPALMLGVVVVASWVLQLAAIAIRG